MLGRSYQYLGLKQPGAAWELELGKSGLIIYWVGGTGRSMLVCGPSENDLPASYTTLLDRFYGRGSLVSGSLGLILLIKEQCFDHILILETSERIPDVEVLGIYRMYRLKQFETLDAGCPKKDH
ncbi:hypothetical protein Tco_0741817 [Tanacetum coccineum]